MDYTFTRIWRVNHRLVIANTIEEAVELYKSWAKNSNDEDDQNITRLIAVGDSQIPENFDAIIKDN